MPKQQYIQKRNKQSEIKKGGSRKAQKQKTESVSTH